MKKQILASILALCSIGVFAQDNMTQSAENLVQSIHLNPASRPNRGFISIPIIGSFQLGIGNSFSYSDMFSARSNGNLLNFPSLVKASMASGNSLTTNFQLDIVNVGFYVTPDDFINISVRGRVHAATSWPMGLMEFVSDNALGHPKEYGVNMKPNAMGWAEVGVGYSRSIGNFTVGARLKYLEGLIGVNSQNGVNMLIDKQYDRYLISADYSLNAGGVMLGKNGMDMRFGAFRNPGFAVDFGATWLSDDERISASASVSDLGRIWWSANSSSEVRARNPNQQFEYDGLGNLLGQGLNFGQLLDSVVKDITATVGVDTLQGVGFITPLPTTFQAMGAYSLGRKLQHNVSLGFVGSLPYRGGFDYAISAGYAYRSPNKVWQLMANYTFRRNNPVNLGVGFVMTTGCFQLYLASDNILAFADGLHARNTAVRLGLNFFFGSESVRGK